VSATGGVVAAGLYRPRRQQQIDSPPRCIRDIRARDAADTSSRAARLS
jgi:hypothetical protein